MKWKRSIEFGVWPQVTVKITYVLHRRLKFRSRIFNAANIDLIFYNNCLLSRALIGSTSIRVQTDKIWKIGLACAGLCKWATCTRQTCLSKTLSRHLTSFGSCYCKKHATSFPGLFPWRLEGSPTPPTLKGKALGTRLSSMILKINRSPPRTCGYCCRVDSSWRFF